MHFKFSNKCVELRHPLDSKSICIMNNGNSFTHILHDEIQRCKYKWQRTKINNTMHIEHTADSNSINWEMREKKMCTTVDPRASRINCYALMN